MSFTSVYQRFSRVASERPDALAIEFGRERLTFGDVDRHAAAIADRLYCAGVRRGDPVIVLSSHRPSFAVSLLGVLRANAAFVPLAADLPDARIQSLCAQIDPGFVLADADQVDRAKALCGGPSSAIEVIPFDTIDLGRHCQRQHGEHEPDPDGLSYIVFTSGSTGEPKPIAGRLRGIGHFVQWEIDTFGLGAQMRGSQLVTPMFDAYLRDVLVPLCAGGTVCIPEEPRIVGDGVALARWMAASGVTLMHTVPSVFRGLLEAAAGDTHLDTLQHVLLSAEPVLPGDVRKWHALKDGRGTLVNLYGQSETTMAKFAYVIQPGDEERKSIPIGRPMPGAQALVLDAQQQVCPQGVVGEIYVRTPYQTLGYYRRPDLTDAVFVPNPFDPSGKERIYRSGDLGRVLEDGTFELLGRRDSQVKVRGVRIELQEVEAALMACRGVLQAAVVDRRDQAGDTMLCAYVALRPEVSTREVREQLRARLPDYMVPVAFVALPTLPLTVTGKIDRQALPAPDFSSREHEYAAPQTPLEMLVAQTWAEVLRVDQVGLDDNFFELGGHSLTATQLAVRVRRQTGIELPLVVLFEAPTVRTLARRLEALQREKRGVTLPALTRQPRGDSVPLSYAQERLWFLEQLESLGATYNQPVTLRFEGPLDVGAIERALNEVIRRHETLRTRIVTTAGHGAQIIDEPRELTLPALDLSTIEEPERTRRMRTEVAAAAAWPFVLAEETFRARLLRLRDEEHVLVLTFHHIMADQWSHLVLLSELRALYTSAIEGRAATLPELEVQYADYALWQREWVQGEALDKQLAYWKGKLAGAPPTLELPTDRPRPPEFSYRGADVHFTIPPTLSETLGAVARREGVTLSMLMLASFQVLLARWSGQTDIVIGVPVAGRSHPATESLIGFFINTLVLRTNLGDLPSFRTLLARVRETALEAYAHQDLPFEKLVSELDLVRDRSRQTLFQVMFDFHNAPVEVPPWPNLRLSWVDSGNTTSKFDLTLFLLETPLGLQGRVEYATDLFDARTIEQLVTSLQTLLQSVAADVEQKVSELPMVTSAERERIEREWSTTIEVDSVTT